MSLILRHPHMVQDVTAPASSETHHGGETGPPTDDLGHPPELASPVNVLSRARKKGGGADQTHGRQARPALPYLPPYLLIGAWPPSHWQRLFG